MPWVKTRVGADVDATLERIKEEYDTNKVEAARRLMRAGMEEYKSD